MSDLITAKPRYCWCVSMCVSASQKFLVMLHSQNCLICCIAEKKHGCDGTNPVLKRKVSQDVTIYNYSGRKALSHKMQMGFFSFVVNVELSRLRSTVTAS